MIAFRISVALAVLMSPVVALSQQSAPDTLHVTSRIVYVDVVVRDAAGRLVRGLSEKDFGVRENGKPQTISYFADHTHDFSSVAETPPSETEFSNVGLVSNSVNIVLFDFCNTASQDQPYARKQMIHFLEALPPGHQTALFVLNTRLHILQNFTGSTDRLVAAAKAMQLASSTAPTTGSRQRSSDFVSAFQAAIGRSPSGASAAADGQLLEAGDEMQRAIDITQEALREIAAAVSGYPGRKNLYWLADRFPLYGGPTLEIHELAASITGSNALKSAPIPGVMNTQDIAEANQSLADAQIAVYPILLTGVDASGMGPEARGMTSQEQLFQQRASLHDMMNSLADTTGGEAYYGTNDFADALRKGFEDGSNYYTLAYIPQNSKWNGAYRKIKINLAAHGYSLSYRRGYYATPENAVEANPAKELNLALQPAAPEATMLRLTSEVVPPDKQNPYFVIKTTIKPEEVHFTTDAAGIRHGRLLVVLATLHEDAKQPEKPRQTSTVLKLDFTPEQYRQVAKAGIQFGLTLALKPGDYRLRLGVWDMSSYRLGTLNIPLTVR